MNIFVLSQNPFEAAQYHCDSHTCKMVIEYAQMLSTAHRYHDGHLTTINLPDGKVKRIRLLEGETASVVPRPETQATGRRSAFTVKVDNQRCYLEAHTNHPCTVWARETDANYHWLCQLFEGCLREYATRYGPVHATSRLLTFLSRAPKHIRRSQLTPFAQAMPEEYKHDDPVEAYRRFYLGAKARFARWRYTPTPTWFVHHLERQDATNLT